jgi:hypothetical protein
VILTQNQHYQGEDGRRTVPVMDRRTSRSFALDLIDTELRDYDQTVRLVVDHTIAPVRAAVGLAAPRPGEDIESLLADAPPLAFRQPTTLTGWQVPADRPDLFAPVSRAMLLFAWLFPAAVPEGELDRLIDTPGQSVLSGTDWLLGHGHDAVADLVARLMGVPTEAELGPEGRPVGPWPEPDWFFNTPDGSAPYSDLRTARMVLRETMDPVGAVHIVADIEQVESGLDHIGWLVARQLDSELRTSVRQRLVWFGRLELEMEPAPGGGWQSTGEILGRSHGVFTAQVPESIEGLAYLDYADQLGGRNDKTGRCAACGRLFVLNAWQRRRLSRREPVYHKECHREHRAAEIRRHHRDHYVPRPREARGSQSKGGTSA